MHYFNAEMAVLPTEPLQITEPFRGRNDLRRNLVGLSRDELKTTLVEAGLEPFRARQVWQWIYWHGVTDFGRMTNIAKKTRRRLAELFVVERPQIVTEQRSVDGTRKWLLRFPDGNEAETVNIPEEDRGSLCVSSQVGCTLTCSFCHTGTQPLVRNLTPAEIVGQFMVARDSYGEWPTPTETTRMLSNIVMMGMGEPLYNFDNVATALKIVMDEQGIALSRRRITLSTSGVVPMIPKVGEVLDVNLAVSLHAVNDDMRDTLVPINRKWPIAELLAACAAYPGARNSRRITFEYAMLKGVNDQRRRRARAGAAPDADPRQGEPDPVQPLAGRALRVQLQQPHPPLRRDRQRRRPQRPRPHPARPRHRRRLRPAQERERRGRRDRRSCFRALLLQIEAVSGMVVAGSAHFDQACRFSFRPIRTNFQRGREQFAWEISLHNVEDHESGARDELIMGNGRRSRGLESGIFPEPLPVIGVRRVIMQCRAHDEADRAAPDCPAWALEIPSGIGRSVAPQ